MSPERTPARDRYDAILDLASLAHRGDFAYVLVKFTYSIQTQECKLTHPEPLMHDLRDESLNPRIVAGTDFWAYKDATDFVVRGSAYAPGGRPTEWMRVSVQIGDVRKEVNVFGPRQISWNGGNQPAIGSPEPFSEMPLTYENAYGGIDWRVDIPDVDKFDVQFMLDVDHPGMYPRNPFGKGYLVSPDPVTGMMMPNLEDPSEPLTPERLIVGDPKLWYRQPLPWCFDWVNVATYPRHVYLGMGVDAWYKGPEDEQMPEVARGFMPKGCRSSLENRGLDQGPHMKFYQGASYGLTRPDIPVDTPVGIQGMHPEREKIVFRVPGPVPDLEFEIEGKRTRVPARLHCLVCVPSEERISMVYGGTIDLPRTFIPGIHKTIPVAVRINGDAPIEFETPPTVKSQMAAAMAKDKNNESA